MSTIKVNYLNQTSRPQTTVGFGDSQPKRLLDPGVMPASGVIPVGRFSGVTMDQYRDRYTMLAVFSLTTGSAEGAICVEEIHVSLADLKIYREKLAHPQKLSRRLQDNQELLEKEKLKTDVAIRALQDVWQQYHMGQQTDFSGTRAMRKVQESGKVWMGHVA